MRALLLLPALALGATSVETRDEAAASACTHPHLERVVVLGASLSDGYGLAHELGGQVDGGDFLAAMLPAGCTPPEARSDSFFFWSPATRGERLASLALADEPSLLFALDFLFWFAYGADKANAAARLRSFERGLEHLTAFDCPIVVADVPDVRIALEGRGPFGVPMLSPSQIPTPATLERLNARLQAWASERGDVVVVPLAGLLERLLAGEELELRGARYGGAREELLQRDLLHPTARGAVAILVLALDALATARDDVSDAAFNWDPDEVLERVRADRAARSETR